ncbi:MAG: AarF/UbiB family protein [Odoribacter splanchnicus]
MIKIRRPNIDQKIKLDLYLMRYLAKKLAPEYPEMAAINIVESSTSWRKHIQGIELL